MNGFRRGQTRQKFRAPRLPRDALRRYHDSKTSLVRGNLKSLPATKQDTVPAPPSAYPTDAPWTPASAAQFPCPSAPAPRKPAASTSSHSRANTPQKAPGSRSSYPSPRQDALPPSPNSPAAPRQSNKSCARPSTEIRPPAAALRAFRSKVSPAPEYQSPR